MTDRRSSHAARLLDPAWHGLRDAVDRLYRELEIGSTELGITVTCRSSDGLVVSYTIELDRPAVLHRLVVPDESGTLAAVEATMINATPDDLWADQ